MKKNIIFKNFTTICFLLLIGVFFLLSLLPCATGAYSALKNHLSGKEKLTLEVLFSSVESTHEILFPLKNQFITLNGGFQRLIGMRNVNDRYLLDNGQLTYIVPEYDITQVAENTIQFQKDLAQQDIPLLYINVPFKIDPDDKQLPAGIEDYANENADAFLSAIENQGTTVLDLRDLEKEAGLDHYSLFFPTDHHWTAEAGFWGYTEIVKKLQQLDSSFAVDECLTDFENYNQTVYKNIFLGSASQRVGPLYAGIDDITVITPKFDTDLRFRNDEFNLDRIGTYEETLIFKEILENKNIFGVSHYTVYCGKHYDILKIDNNSRSKGLDIQSTPKRILMLKDSFSNVLIPFLSLSYDEICFLDLRYFDGDLMTFIMEYQPDMVLITYNPGAFETHNESMFEFYR